MSVKSIDPHTLNQWLSHNEALLIDVREPAEHAANRIDGAHLIPLGQINTGALPETNGKILVIHCLKGGRGQTAAERLLAENPALDIYNLEGGITAWNAAGLKSLSPAAGRKPLPLDRQIQLTIGLGLLITVALTLLVHPYFIALAAIFGTGLTIAGLTGFCGLGIIMARMPWNRA